MIIRFFTLD